MRTPALALGLAVATAGCSDVTFDAVARRAGERAPQTASCDDIDPTRCHLPWPSSRFLVRDEATATGVRIRLDPATVMADDDPASLEAADGFSRVSPLLVGAAGELGSLSDDAVALWVAEPGHPAYGERVPLRVQIEWDESVGESLVVAYPRRLMPESCAHVAVVMAEGGLVATRATSVALDLATPASQEEADLAGYHAPTRAFLGEMGVDPTRVARVWDFVTRSQDDATARLGSMRQAALDALADTTLEADLVTIAPSPQIALVLEGRLTGLPTFGPDGGVIASHDAPFRVVVPEGAGDYPIALYGHGLGGSFREEAFDDELALEGYGKLAVEFHGWTSATILDTLGGFSTPFVGTAEAASSLMQAAADAAAIHHALDGSLGDLLAAAELDGAPNPAAGRRPDVAAVAYAGGSLGGTMGLVYASIEPAVQHGVLNVPGAAWTHFIRSSTIFAPLAQLMRLDLGSLLDVTLVLSMSQTNWDGVDGAIWAEAREKPPVLLIQESVGDPVLPNIGTEMVATSSGAVFVGVPIEPFGDLATFDEAVEQSAITQYRVADDDPLDVHGFADRDTPAGAAARAQIRHFLATARAGEAEIVVPLECPDERCDFAP